MLSFVTYLPQMKCVWCVWILHHCLWGPLLRPDIAYQRTSYPACHGQIYVPVHPSRRQRVRVSSFLGKQAPHPYVNWVVEQAAAARGLAMLWPAPDSPRHRDSARPQAAPVVRPVAAGIPNRALKMHVECMEMSLVIRNHSRHCDSAIHTIFGIGMNAGYA